MSETLKNRLKQLTVFDPDFPKSRQVVFSYLSLVTFLVAGIITLVDLQGQVQWQTYALRMVTVTLLLMAVLVGRMVNSYMASASLFSLAMVIEVYPSFILGEAPLRTDIYWYPIFVLVTGILLNFKLAAILTLLNSLILILTIRSNFQYPEIVSSQWDILHMDNGVELVIRVFVAVVFIFMFRFLRLQYAPLLGRFNDLALSGSVFVIIGACFVWTLNSSWGLLDPVLQFAYIPILILALVDSLALLWLTLTLCVGVGFSLFWGYQIGMPVDAKSSIDILCGLSVLANMVGALGVVKVFSPSLKESL